MRVTRSIYRALRSALSAAAVALCLLPTPHAMAQGLGSINGMVTDQTGAAIPSASVTATQMATGVKARTATNGAGQYVFPALPPAVYTLSVDANGFSSFTQEQVTLQADQALTVNVRLKLAATSTSVVVTSAGPAVNVTSGTVSQVIGRASVNELPLNGRNAAALTTLVAGVTAAPSGAADQGNTKTFPVAVTVSVNGTRANQTNYLLDGGNNVDEYTNVNAPFPFPDAIQEFSVQTSNYQARYGENAGGVVNIITRSGTSQYHGDLFEYVRNRVFNAHNHFSFAKQDGVLKPWVDPLKRNQFGGTLGGPVGIPGVWKAQKGFFFAGYQGTTLRDQAINVSSSSLPTTQNEQGFFTFNSPTPSQIPANCVVDPVSGACFPYTLLSGTTYQSFIDPSRFDRASLALLQYIPVTPTASAFTYLKPTSQNFNEGIGRYDQQLTPMDQLTVRYYANRFDNAGVLDLKNLLTYQDGSEITYQNALVSEAHTFSDHLLNNLIVSYQREGSIRGPNGGSIDAGTLGVQIWQPSKPSIQSISVSGFFKIGDNPQATFRRSNYTLADDLHWVKGNHNIDMGFHGELSRVDVVNQFQQPGTFSFNATTTNSAIASYFLGYLYEFQQGSGSLQDNRGKFLGAYVQDSWKATRRLTLNYGLRYEPFLPLHEVHGRMGQFNPAAYAAGRRSVMFPNAPAGLLFPGDSGMPRDGVRPVYTGFMPRLGFAWDVFGTGTTAVRGGVGMFYDTRSNGLFNNGWIGSTPFSTSVDLIQQGGTFTNPYGSTPNPFPAPAQPSPNAQFILPFAAITFDPSGNFQVPLNYAWNLDVEQQITPTLSSRIAYVGGHASHIFTSPEMNPAVYIPGSTLSTNARRIYKNFTTISLTNMGGNSSYNSLQVTLQKRASFGLSGFLNYTWSKSIDNVPTGAATTSAGAGQSYVLPLYMADYKRLDVGPSDFDHRNDISLAYVWEFPRLTSGFRVARAVINGWQSSGLVALHSGDPLSVMLGQDVSKTGLNRDVPDLIGNPHSNVAAACGGIQLCSGYLNPAAFAKPATGQFGDVKKNSFVGPNYADWDASLTRNFRFGERPTFQFRAEYFNLLNHTNLGDPTLNLSSSSFGRITSASDPRIAQLSLKLLF